jgi:hypothetical protein
MGKGGPRGRCEAGYQVFGPGWRAADGLAVGLLPHGRVTHATERGCLSTTLVSFCEHGGTISQAFRGRAGDVRIACAGARRCQQRRASGV